MDGEIIFIFLYPYMQCKGEKMRNLKWALLSLGLFQGCSDPSQDSGDSSQLASVSDKIIRCESKNGKYTSCDVGGYVVDASLRSQISNTPCRSGSSWGQGDTYIWVDKGCRAEFRAKVATSIQSKVISCNSINGKRSSCYAGSYIVEARLGSVRSNTSCQEGTSWGKSKSEIWVDKGCRADFVVEVAE